MSSARGVPAGNGYLWFKRAVGTLRRHPGTVMLAVSLLLLAMLPLLCIQMGAQFLMAGTTSGIAVQVLATLATGLFAALLIVGLLRLFDSLERTGTGRASDIFSVLRDPGLFARALGFALITLVISLLLIALVLYSLGPDMLGWYGGILNDPFNTAANAPPITRTPWIAAAVGLFGGLLLFGVNSFGYAQVALTHRGAVDAFMDGLDGTARNPLPILVNLAVVIGATLLLTLPMIVLVALAAFVGALVHPLAALVLIVPLYIAWILLLYGLIFATMYHAWRDVFGDALPVHPATDALSPPPASEFSA